jgi:D-alanyl-D-alanine carboxypeptidase
MLDQDPGHPFSSTELIKQVTNHDLKYFYSGEGQQYSNTGYTILGEIIARVYSFRAGSDKTYSDYLYDYVYGPSATVPLQVHFPYLATDQSLPEPFCCGTIIDPGPGEFGTNCQNNMSAHVAEGTGYGTMKELNKYIRTLMKGENLLQPSTVEIMKNSTTTFNSGYALGTLYIKNMGYGHNGAIRGYLSLMLYDPASDVSVVTMMPFWDLSQGEESFLLCFNVVHHLASEARKVLGFTGMS